MARRKIGNSDTTICVSWEDKELFRKFASFVKKTRTGNLYESDAVLFSKMLSNYTRVIYSVYIVQYYYNEDMFLL